MDESDITGARVAESRSSESEAADPSSVSLLTLRLFKDELIWLELQIFP